MRHSVPAREPSIKMIVGAQRKSGIGGEGRLREAAHAFLALELRLYHDLA